VGTSAAYTHRQIVVAELANQSARFALVMLENKPCYPLDGDLSGGKRDPPFQQAGPGARFSTVPRSFEKRATGL